MPDYDRIEHPSLSMQALARFVLETPANDVPEEAQCCARLLLLDTLGVAIAATPMQAGVLARDITARIYAAGTDQDARQMIFDGRRVSLPGAAFAAATQIDNLDAHDGYNPTKGHIGVVAVPTLIAVAETLPDLSGSDALAALAVGYDVAGRAGLALHASVSDYHTSGAWNALGVVAIAARLRRATPEQLRQALGIAEYHGPRSQMMREIANPTMLHDGSGQGALVGLSAMIMAEMGFTGAPAVTVESDQATQHWLDLGQHWQVTQQYIKPYPICRWAHAPIDGAQQLRRDHAITSDQIESVEICSFANAAALFPDVPKTTSQAQYSITFAVATMLVHGAVALEHIEGDGLRDPVVADLMSRTSLTTHARHEARFPAGRWADVTLTLKDGRALNSGDINARGGVEQPFSEAEVIEKFMGLASPILGTSRATAIKDAALGLPSVNSKLSTLTQHLYDPP